MRDNLRGDEERRGVVVDFLKKLAKEISVNEKCNSVFINVLDLFFKFMRESEND